LIELNYFFTVYADI